MANIIVDNMDSAARLDSVAEANRLIVDGVDCNAINVNTGRTPLYTSICFDSRGVFELLLNNPTVNLNLTCEYGKTPLIKCAILANNYMFSRLVDSGCDINVGDDSRRTALHWAAAVNNSNAVRKLLLHGAIIDVGNDRGETPLFLAMKEGAIECVQLLIESNANRNIADNMDRLPQDIALELNLNEIIELLN